MSSDDCSTTLDSLCYGESCGSRIYTQVIFPLLGALDPELSHHLALMLARPCNLSYCAVILRRLLAVEDPRLRVEIAGLHFDNPIGLAAGFDKNCSAPGLWHALGFGHVEYGTITAAPQPGNPRPRIFRLLQDTALINRMGFPSLGIDTVSARLAALRRSGVHRIVGVNIGKTKTTPLERAFEDYVYSFQQVSECADYVAVNVSSPNTPELRKLQEPTRLAELFAGLREVNAANVPIFVKLAPDLSANDLEATLKCCLEHGVAGVIAVNTTLQRDGLHTQIDQSGGLSGSPLTARARQFVAKVYSYTAGELPIIGIGGIMCPGDAIRMLRAGASLIQVYTGFVYRGPCFVRDLNRAIQDYLSNTGTVLGDLIGADVKQIVQTS